VTPVSLTLVSVNFAARKLPRERRCGKGLTDFGHPREPRIADFTQVFRATGWTAFRGRLEGTTTRKSGTTRPTWAAPSRAPGRDHGGTSIALPRAVRPVMTLARQSAARRARL